MFIKKHESQFSSNSKPSERTLLVVNVPSSVDVACLRQFFAVCGAVEKVYEQQKPTCKDSVEKTDDAFSVGTNCVQGFHAAYIVFKNPSALALALQPGCPYRKSFSDKNKRSTMKTGVQRWCQRYERRYTDESLLQQQIDTFMQEFDQREAQECERVKQSEGVPDEEGWVTVTRHSKNKGLSRTEELEHRLTASHGQRQKNKALLNFYTFQKQQARKEHLNKLRHQFEEDKLRVQSMKAARKFRPF